MEELLARIMELAVTLKLIVRKELARAIVDSTVQEKAITQATDSKKDWKQLTPNWSRQLRPAASNSNSHMPKKVCNRASRLFTLPMHASSSAYARPSNASAPSSVVCTAKWVAR